MLCRKSYCCLLWRFVALFVLFSILLFVNVSASGYSDELDDFYSSFKGDRVDVLNGSISFFADGSDFDGYTVKYYYKDYNGIDTDFNGSLLPFTLSPITIWIDIILPEVISRREIVDIISRINFSSGYDECGDFRYRGVNPSMLSFSLGSVDDITIRSGILSFCKDEISLSQSISHLRLYFLWTPSSEDSLLDFTFNSVNVDVVSNSGLLSSIIDSVSNIFAAIVDLPANIANSIKGFFDNVVNAVNKVFTAISELPAKIWNLIETGLKNLFVPTEGDLQEYYDKWDVLMSERFGALYEVVNIVTDFIDSFQSYNETGTIVFPAVTLDLAGSPFTFGGWTVPIVPAGLEFLFDSVKLAIDMVATYAFVFGLKRRYEELVERG